METKKYKFITIQPIKDPIFETYETYNGHQTYGVTNNKSGDEIAKIYYYEPWKQYVFESHESCVFNSECRLNIVEFLRLLNKED